MRSTGNRAGSLLSRRCSGAALVLLAMTPVIASCNGAGSVAGPFAGTWRIHAFSLTIGTTGDGSFAWAIHCLGGTSSPPPCRGSDAYFIPQHASIALSSRHGQTAAATISSSSDTTTVPDGTVSARIGANDLLYLTVQGSPVVPSYPYLCGERASARWADGKGAINCGA